jgi:hypothetical protein
LAKYNNTWLIHQVHFIDVLSWRKNKIKFICRQLWIRNRWIKCDFVSYMRNRWNISDKENFIASPHYKHKRIIKEKKVNNELIGRHDGVFLCYIRYRLEVRTRLLVRDRVRVKFDPHINDISAGESANHYTKRISSYNWYLKG